LSNQALDLLIEYELLKSNGKVVDIESLPNVELSRRYSAYVNARRSLLFSEIDNYEATPELNAQFSTWSSKPTKEKILSSLLVYNKLVLNDPLVSSDEQISVSDLIEGVNLFSWLHPLIRAGFISLFPINYFDKPSNDVPLLQSEDAFKSEIPKDLHDYTHENVILRSVIPNDKGEMLILTEEATVKRRTALHVGFKNDALYSGVSLYLFQTMESVKETIDGSLNAQSVWDKNEILSKEKFAHWAYQATNQAMLARLKAIYNQSFLAEKLGNTYITESQFESSILSFSGSKNTDKVSPAVDFMSVNDSFFQIDSPNTIVDLREKHASAFSRFNASLILASNELQNINASEFEKRSASILHNEILPQVDLCRDVIRQIQSGATKGALVSLGGIALGIATGTVVPLIPALMYSASSALSESLSAVGALQNEKKKPSYIWHRITKRT
jgi:hypothetical protein